MATIKKLLSQTAIYGLSTVIGRVLNFLLVPLYTKVFNKEEYGEVTILYSLTAIFNVFLSYGMETAYFNFINKENSKDEVFTTAFFSILSSSVSFLLLGLLFSTDIANILKFSAHPEYIVLLVWILFFDAVTVIPFAKLRAENRAFKFAVIKLTNIGTYIGLNLFVLVLAPFLISKGFSLGMLDSYLAEPQIDVIFFSNAIASALTMLMLVPTFRLKTELFNKDLLHSMLRYAWPILIAGTAGIINETMDRQFLLYMLPEETAMGQIGIYGANYKIAIFMTLFIQAFRMGVEPFFFAKSRDNDAKETYAFVMNYFVAIMSLIYLFLVVNLDILKHFIRNEEMWAGLDVVPILLFANLSLGIYINLSVWYKVSEKTKYGALFSIVGAIITIVLNLALIPVMGFYGSAWATLGAYSAMMLMSYFTGQKKYPVPYNIKKIVLYIGVAVFAGLTINRLFYGNFIIGNTVVVLFVLMLMFFESGSLRKILLKK